jgi:hypothetical protein
MNNKNSNENNMRKVVTISAGVAALVAAGYFFLGPKGKKNQRATKAWMIKMKGDVVEKLESVQEITQEAYDAIVDTVSGAYEAAAGSKEEVAKLARELKSHWREISKKAIAKGKKTIKKVSKPRP